MSNTNIESPEFQFFDREPAEILEDGYIEDDEEKFVFDKSVRIKKFQEESIADDSIYRETKKDYELMKHLEQITFQCYEHYKKDIRALLLTPKNEGGQHKFICSTIRPTFTSVPELQNQETCAQHISNLINQEPLSPPNKLPEFIPSPSNVLKWQEGDCFDMSILLTSILIGNGYNAFCVQGQAPKAVTEKDTSLMECPEWLKEKDGLGNNRQVNSWIKLANFNDQNENEGDSERLTYMNEFKVADKTDFQRSDFQLEQKAKREARQLKMEEEERDIWVDNVPDLEDEDEFAGRRFHCWVMVQAGKRGVDTACFIEPSTGTRVPMGSAPYERVVAVFNNRNYFLNMNEDTPLQELNWDLYSRDDWQGIIFNEEDFNSGTNPNLEVGGVEDNEPRFHGKDIVVPHPWSQALQFDRKKLLELCPNGQKVLSQRKLRVELFGKQEQPDGLVKRYTQYKDQRKVIIDNTSSYQAAREDHLVNMIVWPQLNKFEQNFAPGRSEKDKETMDKDKCEHIKRIVKIDGIWRKYWFQPYRIDCLIEKEDNIQRLNTDEKDDPHPYLDFFDDSFGIGKDQNEKSSSKRPTYCYVIENFIKREKEPYKRTYFLSFDDKKTSSTTDNKSYIETDMIRTKDDKPQEGGKKNQGAIMKIELEMEPDPDKGKANSLHKVTFDFEKNLTTWVNHREMGKLNPECYQAPTGSQAEEMLFERGFIPNKCSSDEELDQTANYLSQELQIKCKNDMSQISSRLNKWRADNISAERTIAENIREASANKANPDKEKGQQSILRRSIQDKVILEKSERPAHTADDIKQDEDDKNKEFDFIDNIIQAEGLDKKKLQFSNDEAYDIVSKCEEYLRERIIKRAANISDKLEKLSQEYKNKVSERGQSDNSSKTTQDIEQLSFKISIQIERAAKHEETALKMYQELTDRLRKDNRFKLYFDSEKN